MTTTRISHTGHNHPSTPAARTACRKAMKATKVGGLEICTVGNGKAVHYVDVAVGTTRCGKADPKVITFGGHIDDVTCKGCRSKYGQAHG
jgi:hypothetical protein